MDSRTVSLTCNASVSVELNCTTSPMPANPSELCDSLSIAHFTADAPDFSGHMIRQTTKKSMSRPL